MNIVQHLVGIRMSECTLNQLRGTGEVVKYGSIGNTLDIGSVSKICTYTTMDRHNIVQNTYDIGGMTSKFT